MDAHSLRDVGKDNPQSLVYGGMIKLSCALHEFQGRIMLMGVSFFLLVKKKRETFLVIAIRHLCKEVGGAHNLSGQSDFLS